MTIQRYEHFVATQAAKDQFSGTVLLVHRDRHVLARSYGMANKKAGIPNRLDTVFGLGSVSKLFAVVGLVQLVRQGKVDLHAPLGTYLSGFRPEVANSVTVHQVLIATSGFDDFQRNPEYQENKDEWDTPEEEFNGTMAIIRKMPLRAKPGTQYSVLASNPGLFVTEAILQEVSGQSRLEYVREHVLTPAGIDRTHPVPEARIAHRYGPPGPDGRRPDLTAEGKGSNGSESVSALEMLGFARALMDGETLLDPAHTALLTSGKNPLDPADRHLSQPKTGDLLTAYGLDLGLVNGQRVFRRTGEVIIPGGLTAGLCVYPDLDWIAVILGNYYFDIVPYLELLDEIVTSTRRR